MSVLRTLPPAVEKVWITVEDRAFSVVREILFINLASRKVEIGG
jgi:hypothetical protein